MMKLCLSYWMWPHPMQSKYKKKQMKDYKQNLCNDTDDEKELELLDNEDENTLTEDESFQQTQKDQQQYC